MRTRPGVGLVRMPRTNLVERIAGSSAARAVVAEAQRPLDVTVGKDDLRARADPDGCSICDRAVTSGAVSTLLLKAWRSSPAGRLGLVRLGRRQRATARGPRQLAAPTRSSPVISTCFAVDP